jgi:hypothetical protein
MIKVKMLESFKTYKEGNVYAVDNDVADNMIDSGIAEYHIQVPIYKNRMMKPRRI